VPPYEWLPDRLGRVPIDVIDVGLPRVHALSHTDEMLAPGLAGFRRATLTALRQGPDSVWLLVSGHAALPLRNQRLKESYGPADPPAFIQVEDEDGSRFRAILRQGELGAERPVDWALAEVFDVPDAQSFHYGVRDVPPFRIRNGLPSPGEGVSHFSRLRDRRVEGTFQQVAQTPVELLLPDGRTTRYSDVLAIASKPGLAFSLEGDSGSLVVDDQLKVLGTVLGASANNALAYVLPIHPLIQRLGRVQASSFFL
jgi:hypothetical protein